MPIQEIDYDPFAEQYVKEKELQKRRNILEVDYDPFVQDEDSPAAAPPKREALQPPASKVGTLGGVASALGPGLAEGVPTAIPQIVAATLLGPALRGLFDNRPIFAMALSGVSLLSAALALVRVQEPSPEARA